jgi:hypothetical protein
MAAREGKRSGSGVPGAAAVVARLGQRSEFRRDPWSVLISEAVLGGRGRSDRLTNLLERFPDASTAAECPSPADRTEQHVVALAKTVVDRFRGQIPGTAEELQELPGVTAACAQLVIALTQGNCVPRSASTLRVAHRVSRVPAEGTLSGLVNVVLARLTRFGCSAGANVALVEIGRATCLPESPLCDACPLADHCASRRATLASQLRSKERR